MADSDSVELGADRHIVPDSGPLANHHVADEASVGSNPGIAHLGDSVVEGHLLAMTGRLLQVCDVVGESASKSVKFYEKGNK